MGGMSLRCERSSRNSRVAFDKTDACDYLIESVAVLVGLGGRRQGQQWAACFAMKRCNAIGYLVTLLPSPTPSHLPDWLWSFEKRRSELWTVVSEAGRLVALG